MQTSDILTDLEFADDVNLKRLYNYHCATNRNNYESMIEAREEYITQRESPQIIRMWLKIAEATSIANRMKKQRENKIEKVFEMQKTRKKQ